MSVMLYKVGGPHKIHDGNFHYIIVDESEVDAKLKEGWSATTVEAKAPKKPAAKRKAKTEE